MTIVRHEAPTEIVIEIDGAFDMDTASCLFELVEGLDRMPLTLDFREVRLFHDSAISSLAEALSRHPEARVVGLSQHQFRLLRYLTPAHTPSPLPGGP